MDREDFKELMEAHDEVFSMGMDASSKNAALLEDFTRYCREHPEYRFWQALRNWTGRGLICLDGFDTFYFEGKKQ